MEEKGREGTYHRRRKARKSAWRAGDPPTPPLASPHPLLPLRSLLLLHPFLSSPSLLSLPPLPSLVVGPLKSSYGVWGSAVSSASGVGAPAGIVFGAF